MLLIRYWKLSNLKKINLITQVCPCFTFVLQCLRINHDKTKHFKTPLKSVYSFFIVIYNKNMNEESKGKLKLLQVVMSLKRKLGLCRVFAIAIFLRYASELASPALTILDTGYYSNTRN